MGNLGLQLLPLSNQHLKHSQQILLSLPILHCELCVEPAACNIHLEGVIISLLFFFPCMGIHYYGLVDMSDFTQVHYIILTGVHWYLVYTPGY